MGNRHNPFFARKLLVTETEIDRNAYLKRKDVFTGSSVHEASVSENIKHRALVLVGKLCEMIGQSESQSRECLGQLV